MAVMIWAGTALAVLGLLGILGCVVAVLKARRARLDDAQMKAKLQQVLAWNMGAFMAAAFGLVLVVVGIILA